MCATEAAVALATMVMKRGVHELERRRLSVPDERGLRGGVE
jgi:hypothetical protein